MKTAIITGVTGQDGSYLAELLLANNYKVIGLKRRTSTISTDRVDHIFDDKNFEMRYYSLYDAGAFYRLIQEYNPDEIYNLAAQSHVKVSFETPEETVNSIALATLRILEAIRILNPKIKFYQASSSEMFGDNPENPQSEKTQFMPASPYACAKVFAHNICNNYRKSYGLFICCGILFNHESPRRGETFVTRKITMAAARIKFGLQDKLYLGNLDAKRDWGHAEDYVYAMWLMLQQDKPDDYVIATGQTHTVREFLQEVFNHAKLDIDKYVEIDENLFRPHEVPLLLGDPTKAQNVLNWTIRYKFKELSKCMYEADYQLVKREMK